MCLNCNLDMPDDARQYMKAHGPHFSKKLCEYAVSKMENKHGNKHFTVDEVESKLKAHNIPFDENDAYDAVYAFNMYYSDFYPDAMPDEKSLCNAVNCILNDPDGYPGMLFVRWFADVCAKGTPIRFERFI